MMSKQRLYWACQGLGWSSFILLVGTINRLEEAEAPFDIYSFLSLLIMTLLGILISHTYRELIIQLDWLRFKIVDLIPRVVLTSVLCGVAFFFLYRFLLYIVILREKVILSMLELLEGIISLSIFFILWSTLYFLFHFIQNYRKEEIKNLRWQALSTEVELNKLKSQLNPHFIFNSMNSIRALVDENPEKSKDSITQLSNILRSSLLTGRKKVIPLSQELQLVKDYLSLEQTRFEERLRTTFEIDDEVKEHHVPPLMLQTLVENGIKHGISQLEEGGEIIVRARKKREDLILSIENTGHFREKKERNPGFGLLNSRQRLFLLYGERGNIRINNTENNTVLVEVLIPKQPKKLVTPEEFKEI